jgi:hypothetical protein
MGTLLKAAWGKGGGADLRILNDYFIIVTLPPFHFSASQNLPFLFTLLRKFSEYVSYIPIYYMYCAYSIFVSILTHCRRVTQIYVFNMVKLGTSASSLCATQQGGMFPEVSHPQALLGSLVSIS